MNTICVDPETDPLWLRLLDQVDSSLFHSPRWMHVLNKTYNLNIRAYMLLDEQGAPKAGLSFCYIVDIMGKRIVTLPFSDFCDPLVTDIALWNYLLDKLLPECCPLVVRCLHNCLPLNDKRFTLIKQAKWHGRDLRSDLDTIWNSMHESSRRAIKKAQREGVVVRIAQSEKELREFFALHLRIRKYKYRLLAQPYQFFLNLWREFVEKSHGVLMIAVHQEVIVGGILFLAWKETLYYKFNASASSGLSFRPNDLLIWEGIQYGKKKGYAYLDFGLSDLDQEGLMRFKRKFAPDEKTISFLCHNSKTAQTRQEEEARQLLPSLTELLTNACVPDQITAKAGELLYRFFA